MSAYTIRQNVWQPFCSLFYFYLFVYFSFCFVCLFSFFFSCSYILVCLFNLFCHFTQLGAFLLVCVRVLSLLLVFTGGSRITLYRSDSIAFCRLLIIHNSEKTIHFTGIRPEIIALLVRTPYISLGWQPLNKKQQAVTQGFSLPIISYNTQLSCQTPFGWK